MFYWLGYFWEVGSYLIVYLYTDRQTRWIFIEALAYNSGVSDRKSSMGCHRKNINPETDSWNFWKMKAVQETRLPSRTERSEVWYWSGPSAISRRGIGRKRLSAGHTEHSYVGITANFSSNHGLGRAETRDLWTPTRKSGREYFWSTCMYNYFLQESMLWLRGGFVHSNTVTVLFYEELEQ